MADDLYIFYILIKSQPCRRSLVGYKHVVDVEYCPPISTEGPRFPSQAAKAKEAARAASYTQKTVEYYDLMEGMLLTSPNPFIDTANPQLTVV